MPRLSYVKVAAAGQIQEGELLAAIARRRGRRCCGASRSRSPDPREGREIKLGPRVGAEGRDASGSRSSPASSPTCSTPVCRSSSAWRSWATRARTSTFQTSSSRSGTDVEAGVSLADVDAQAPQGVRQPVHQHGGGGRGGRYPRHHPAAPLRLHREGRQAQEPGQGAPDLPDQHHQRGHARHRVHARLRHPDVRRRCSRSMGAELPLPTRIVIGALGLRARLLLAHRRWSSPAPCTASGRTTRRTTGGSSSTP